MSILPFSGLISTCPQSLSSSNSLGGGSMSADVVFLKTKISTLSLTIPGKLPSEWKLVRMGGGPRTYPGGVTKWQWKRMQANKAKQLLKARLAREREIYEMRKRAELKAAVSELERPWETIEKAPTLFSSNADEQLKVLADRFQKPGGFDLWSEKDGPQLFRPDNGLPSARFFPKGVVHSTKPYGISEKMNYESGEFGNLSSEEDPVMSETDEKMRVPRKMNIGNSTMRSRSSFDDQGRSASDFRLNSLENVWQETEGGKLAKGRVGQKGIRRRVSSDSDVGFDQKNNRSRIMSGFKADYSYSGVNNMGDFGSKTLKDVPEESQVGKFTTGRRGKGDIRGKSLSASKGEFDRKINRSDSRPGYSAEDSYSGVYNKRVQNLEDVAKESPRGQFTEGRKRGIGRKPFSGSKVGFDGRVNRSNSRSGHISEDSSSGVYNMSVQNDGSYGFEIDT